MKTSELTGQQLDYWVSRAEGKELKVSNGGLLHVELWHGECEHYSPSTNWAQAGPIIEQLKPTSFYYWKPSNEWTCAWGNGPKWRTGPTALIAAMRCFVASKFENGSDDSQTHSI